MCEMCDDPQLTAWALTVMTEEVAWRQRQPHLAARDRAGHPRREAAALADAA